MKILHLMNVLTVPFFVRKHKENVKFYYQKWMEDQAQNLIDATTAAFKAGKLAPGAPGPGGVAIPPPMAMGGPPMMHAPPPMMGMPPRGPHPMGKSSYFTAVATPGFFFHLYWTQARQAGPGALFELGLSHRLQFSIFS